MRVSSVEVAALFGDALSYRETMAGGPPWLCWPLVATPAARSKLTDWARRAPRPWATPDAATLLTRLAVTGDEEIAYGVAEVLSELPPPVIDYARTRVSFLAVGLRISGWCGARPDLADRPFVIVLGPADRTRDGIRRVIAHEVAHAWLLPEPPPSTVAAGALWMETVHGLPLGEVPEAAREAVLARRQASAVHERQAEALVAAWGFPDPPHPAPTAPRRRRRR
ncbi:MAG TPA: hypothetical protein VF406_12915 [Thermodesulfobacteriota bacterium]